MSSALLQPFDSSVPYNLAFEDQENTGDTSDLGTPEQLNDATPNLTACLSCAQQNGLMVLTQIN